jgi:hypothetical protein
MVESLFAKSGFQAFLFTGATILVIRSLATAPLEPALQARTIDRIVLLALAAMVAFVVALVVRAIRGPETSTKGVTPAETPESWPTMRDVRITRGFMLLGILIYMAYHFLDGFVLLKNPALVAEILRLRLLVSACIVLVWLASLLFVNWFRAHYVLVIGGTTALAGLGVAAMMLLAGPEIHFYYEGFIQVIAFAAFAFRLPPKALAWECALLMSLYVTIAIHQAAQQRFDVPQAQQAVLLNNLVSLVTFVTLALSASAALGRR